MDDLRNGDVVSFPLVKRPGRVGGVVTTEYEYHLCIQATISLLGVSESENRVSSIPPFFGNNRDEIDSNRVCQHIIEGLDSKHSYLTRIKHLSKYDMSLKLMGCFFFGKIYITSVKRSGFPLKSPIIDKRFFAWRGAVPVHWSKWSLTNGQLRSTPGRWFYWASMIRVPQSFPGKIRYAAMLHRFFWAKQKYGDLERFLSHGGYPKIIHVSVGSWKTRGDFIAPHWPTKSRQEPQWLSISSLVQSLSFNIYLVGGWALWKIWVSQLGWWHSQYIGK